MPEANITSSDPPVRVHSAKAGAFEGLIFDEFSRGENSVNQAGNVGVGMGCLMDNDDKFSKLH